MNETRVLYLSYDGLGDPLGESQILPYLRELAGRSIQITVISFEKEPPRADLKQECQRIGIEWIPLNYHKSPPIVSTLYDLWKMRKQALGVIHRKNIQIVHCRSYLPALVGLRLKRSKGLRFLFDMRGFWADERIEGGIWNHRIYRPVYRYFKKKERQFLKEADHIISLTERAKKYIESNFESAPITVIPCCVDLDLFNPVQSDSGNRPIRLGYVGSLGTWYMVDEMIDFFAELRKMTNASLLIVTRDEPSIIYKRAADLGVHDAIEVRSAQREEVPGLISDMDICLMFIRPVFSKIASSPTKMAEVMAMNKPIICNVGVGDIDRLMKENKVGVSVQDFSDVEYRKVATEALQLDVGTRPREIAVRDFSLEKGVELYARVYQEMLEN